MSSVNLIPRKIYEEDSHFHNVDLVINYSFESILHEKYYLIL